MPILTFSHPGTNPANRALLVANRRACCLRFATTLLAASIVPALLPANAEAQGSRVAAALEGTVRDSSGAAIPGSAVVARNASTNQARTTETDAEGSFHMQALAVGSYEVRVDQAGFAPYRHGDLDLTLGQTTHLGIVLVPASLSEEVSVNAQDQAFELSQASVVSPVDRERIEELPVQSRNSLDFVLLAPGVLSAPPAPPVAGGTPLLQPLPPRGPRRSAVAASRSAACAPAATRFRSTGSTTTMSTADRPAPSFRRKSSRNFKWFRMASLRNRAELPAGRSTSSRAPAQT
jgi:hypothetical protein